MRALLVFLPTLLAGCSAPPALDQEVKVAFSDQAVIEGEALTLTFKDMNEDSRCPENVQCVWEGRATITIEALKEGGTPGALALTLPSPSAGTYSGYSISLLALEPHPEAGSQTPLEEYVATLVVTKQ